MHSHAERGNEKNHEHIDGSKLETHRVENTKTGEVVEMKTKLKSDQ